MTVEDVCKAMTHAGKVVVIDPLELASRLLSMLRCLPLSHLRRV
jgi:hypothetical protein